jgi:Protein of unknown function (DUF4013)
MSSAYDQQSFKISPVRAINAVFQSPNWMVNVMWLCLGVLLSIIGNIFIFGYGSQVMQSRAGRPEYRHPDIDSGNLGNLFMRGLWPFLVQMIASLGLAVVTTFPLFFLMFIGMAVAANIGEAGPPLVLLIFLPLLFCAIVISNLILVPITIRAMICQDFAKSFDVAWIKSFIKLMWKDVLASMLLMLIIFIGLYVVGLMLCIIGVFPAIAIGTSALLNLLSQWYEMFLIRGGQPAPPPADFVVDATVV